MDFNQSSLTNRNRSSPHDRLPRTSLRNLAISVLLGPTVLFAPPATTQSAAAVEVMSTQIKLAQAESAQPAAQKPVQQIALHQSDMPSEAVAGKADYHFRLLGYGLFLLHIGLLPLKLSKGHLMQFVDARSHR